MAAPANDVFMNRKRWSGIDVKRLEIALAKFDPVKMPLNKYIERIKDDFPTRSPAAIKEKFNELAALLGMDLVAPGTRAKIAGNLDSRWTPEELTLLDELLQEFDPLKKSAREFGREIADFFRERHSELAIMQRVSLLTREVRENAVAQGQMVPGQLHMRRTGEDSPGFTEALQAVAERVAQRTANVAADRTPERPPAPAPAPLLALPAPEEPPKFREVPGLRRNEPFDAIVTGTADYGVFVRVSVGSEIVEGLVHFAEIADSGISYINPRDEFHIGEQLEVVWLERTPKGHAFSLKRAGYVMKTSRKGPTPPLPALPPPSGAPLIAYNAYTQTSLPFPALPAPARPAPAPVAPRTLTPPPQPKPVVQPTAANVTAALTSAKDPGPGPSLIDRLTDHLIEATRLTQEMINNQSNPDIQLAWDAVNEALVALNAMELKKGINILEMYKVNHMTKKEQR